ncbi:Glu-tRNA(Gln) amidotransferase subunit GatE [Candidatus Woesearchaeota archaeon]|nr:Glu-tRNA(Gln) amidotransferase subunit GatE [Candidatus Woesearchaeota archaeon]
MNTNLKIGLEIHRQINTHKLFCNCPSELIDKEPDFQIKRYLRAVESEIGEKDIVAQFEVTKGKHAIYQGYKDKTCLLETDEEPPHSINPSALKAILEVALLLNCKVQRNIQVMRKQVLDLSNTSGFQRTALVATDGFVEVNGKKIGINTICLEEDAARKISEGKDFVIFRLDRLGIPLIEITTKPDIKNAEEAKEVAAYLGMLIKSTGKFKSGLGTIRQDVNLSINNNPRIELKGVQDLDTMNKVINIEVKRQLDLLKESKKIVPEVRKVNQDLTTSFLRPMPGAARMYVETDHPEIEISDRMLKSIKLPKLITEKAIDLEKEFKLSAQLAKEILDVENKFRDYVKKYKNLETEFIARTLIEIPKEIKTRLKFDISKLKDKNFEFVFENINNKTIPKSAAIEILSEICEDKTINLEKYKTLSEVEVERIIKEIVNKNKEAPFNALMGIAMGRLKGKADGSKVAELIKKNLN